MTNKIAEFEKLIFLFPWPHIKEKAGKVCRVYKEKPRSTGIKS